MWNIVNIILKNNISMFSSTVTLLFQIMQLMALWGPLIYGGCWAATLSTALTNLLSVPRLIQALGIDRIYPGLIFFSKPYGRHGEPYRGYLLTFCVSLLFLLIGKLFILSNILILWEETC